MTLSASSNGNFITEEIEGIEAGNGNLGDYPIDSLLIRTENRTVFEVVRRMNAKQYILDPDFQRDFVWDSGKQSKLIESAIMRIPLPVFYLAEQNDGRIVVVDGLQRLTTFHRFLNNEFRLRGLSGVGESLEGKTFDELPAKLRTRLEDTNLTLYLIDSKVPEQAKLDIFDRVNSGVPLSRQQMRNCLHSGRATRWLKEQAQSEWFLTATKGSLNPNTMRDREAINRFCGFYLLGVDNYRGDMDAFLAQTLHHMNQMNNEAFQGLSDAFQLGMKNNFTFFGRHTFRKHDWDASDLGRLRPINIALFDVMSVILARYDGFDERHKDTFQSVFYSLMADENFVDAITFSTNSTSKVRYRFNAAQKAFDEAEYD